MELVHWVLVAVGIAVALVTQWFLLGQHSRDWKPMRDQIAEQVTQSAALVEECASGFSPKA